MRTPFSYIFEACKLINVKYNVPMHYAKTRSVCPRLSRFRGSTLGGYIICYCNCPDRLQLTHNFLSWPSFVGTHHHAEGCNAIGRRMACMSRPEIEPCHEFDGLSICLDRRFGYWTLFNYVLYDSVVPTVPGDQYTTSCRTCVNVKDIASDKSVI